MMFPVFDLHCDTALAMLGDDYSKPRELLKNDLHVDLVRTESFPCYAQCFACFTTSLHDSDPTLVFQRELKVLQEQITLNSGKIRLAATPAQIEQNARRHIASAVLTLEGPAGIAFDPAKLEELRKIGFCMTTLGWNEANPLTGSHVTGGGLTDMGRIYVQEAQRLGMIIDVSHISDRAFWDILEISQKPIVASHSNSRTVCNVSRNLTDDMFRAICCSGGVAGINLYAAFLGDNATLDTVCDHILHFMELDPSGSHIALGGDLDGCDQLPREFHGIQDYPKLAEHLVERGLDQSTINNLFWSNALGVIKKCCM